MNINMVNLSAVSASLDRQEAFKNDIRVVIKQAVAKLRREGTVGISVGCLWGCSVGQLSGSVHGPAGANAPYFARQAFDEVVSEKQFSKFVYQA